MLKFNFYFHIVRWSHKNIKDQLLLIVFNKSKEKKELNDDILKWMHLIEGKGEKTKIKMERKFWNDNEWKKHKWSRGIWQNTLLKEKKETLQPKQTPTLRKIQSAEEENFFVTFL